jgi:hypothetical protein
VILDIKITNCHFFTIKFPFWNPFAPMERPNDRPTTPSSIRQDDHQTKQPVPSNNTNDLTTTQPLDEKIEVISTKQDAPDDEYPSGIKLVAIVVALILAIFLASLDMVRLDHPDPLLAPH